MTAPKLKVEDGEQVIHSTEGLRKTKYLFGSLFGALHVTNRRVVFVKAVISGGIAKLVFLNDAKPKIAFERSAITSVEAVQYKKHAALVIADATRREMFLMEPAERDAVVRQLQS